jgi:hypothetical protein
VQPLPALVQPLLALVQPLPALVQPLPALVQPLPQPLLALVQQQPALAETLLALVQMLLALAETLLALAEPPWQVPSLGPAAQQPPCWAAGLLCLLWHRSADCAYPPQPASQHSPRPYDFFRFGMPDT